MLARFGNSGNANHWQIQVRRGLLAPRLRIDPTERRQNPARPAAVGFSSRVHDPVPVKVRRTMDGRLERFRRNKDDFFKTDPHSPLTAEQKRAFHHLDYYRENAALSFKLRIDRDAVSHDPVMLDTTTGTQQEFVPAGKISIEVEGRMVRLTLYRETGRGRYFLPFRDATNGLETYAGGRYLDPQETPDGLVTVDFNYAYNPYCAYNDEWTCPIPPVENVLEVPVRAGEKDFSLDEPAHP